MGEMEIPDVPPCAPSLCPPWAGLQDLGESDLPQAQLDTVTQRDPHKHPNPGKSSGMQGRPSLGTVQSREWWLVSDGLGLAYWQQIGSGCTTHWEEACSAQEECGVWIQLNHQGSVDPTTASLPRHVTPLCLSLLMGKWGLNAHLSGVERYKAIPMQHLKRCLAQIKYMVTATVRIICSAPGETGLSGTEVGLCPSRCHRDRERKEGGAPSSHRVGQSSEKGQNAEGMVGSEAQQCDSH